MAIATPAAALEQARHLTQQIIHTCRKSEEHYRDKLLQAEKKLSEENKKTQRLSEYIQKQNKVLNDQKSIIIELKKQNSNLLKRVRLGNNKSAIEIEPGDSSVKRKNNGEGNRRSWDKFSYGS